MILNKILKKRDSSIEDSLNTYQKNLMSDINLILRVTYNKNTYITKPVEWVDRMIVFEAPISQLDWVIYPEDTRVDVVFVSKLALFHTELRILRNYKKGNSLFYVGEITRPLTKKQQREHFRLEVIVNISFQLLSETISQDFNASNLTYHKGFCVNISTGGMCLNADQQLHQGQRLSLEFDFIDHHFVFLGEVLGLGEQNSAGSYTHRIKFLNIDDADNNLLNRLIFEKQRLLLKKSK